MFHNDTKWLSVFGAIVLIVTGLLSYNAVRPEWKDYQEEFRDVIAKKFGAEKATQVPDGLQQVWVKDLRRVDRCITCHQGIEWKGLENEPNPFKAHPREILQKHPVQQFGCTVCHGGQGYGTNTESAHGFVEHWEEPLLGKELSEVYLVKDQGALLQMNCNRCHRYERETKGADSINHAKRLVQEKNCRACHTINGRGGVIGPELTNVGNKSPDQYDYSRLSGIPSSFAWHVAHFQNPKALVAESIMPNFGLSSRDAQALALLVLSWKSQDPPAQYLPGVKLVDRPTPEEAEREQQMLTGEGAFFVKKGCFICHSVSTLGIESASKIGPDLADAVVDVQSRFGKTLEDFLNKPTGTMAVVLSTQIQLTEVEKREAIDKLKVAYQKKLEPQAQPQKKEGTK